MKTTLSLILFPNTHTFFPHRGLFIIDNKRILRQITMNDLPVGRSVDETLRLVQAFQYTDKHGEGALLNVVILKIVLLSLEVVFVAFWRKGAQ